MRARERLCHRQQKRRESRQRAGLCGLLTNCCLTPPSLSSPLYSAPDAKNEMKQKKKATNNKKKSPPCPLSHCSTPDKRRLFISSARGEIINSSISERLSEGGRRGQQPLPPQGPLPPQRPLPPLRPELVDVLIPMRCVGAEIIIIFSRMVSKSKWSRNKKPCLSFWIQIVCSSGCCHDFFFPFCLFVFLFFYPPAFLCCRSCRDKLSGQWLRA